MQTQKGGVLRTAAKKLVALRRPPVYKSGRQNLILRGGGGMGLFQESHKSLIRKKLGAMKDEVSEFPHLGQKHLVMGVPKIVINERTMIEGALPEARFIQEVLNAAGSANARGRQ
jgi:hypothetical protein